MSFNQRLYQNISKKNIIFKYFYKLYNIILSYYNLKYTNC